MYQYNIDKIECVDDNAFKLVSGDNYLFVTKDGLIDIISHSQSIKIKINSSKNNFEEAIISLFPPKPELHIDILFECFYNNKKPNPKIFNDKWKDIYYNLDIINKLNEESGKKYPYYFFSKNSFDLSNYLVPKEPFIAFVVSNKHNYEGDLCLWIKKDLSFYYPKK